ncbi:MAG: desulfoferrodoxin [Minisyncoccia bacterium]
MPQKKQIYRCNICGNIIEVLDAGKGQLVCCGEPMELLRENTTDASSEKHVPLIDKTEFGFKVRVGSVPHPMEDEHYIEWIELNVNGNSFKKFLNPHDLPEAEFRIEGKIDEVMARAYCNLHGLWKSK